jgi:HAD superfamily hydrolase (TIGR01490 family)
MNLALFDLDHTLIPIDSDHAWGEFYANTGAVDTEELRRSNDEWYAHYLAGTLDPVKYLEFVFGHLSRYPRAQLDAWRQDYLRDVITPNITPAAKQLVRQHLDAGDLVAIVTATNHFITEPIAPLFDVEHLIAAMPELTADGNFTGKISGLPTQGPGKITHTERWLAAQGKTFADFERVYFYSDSPTDLPLLSYVSHPVATNPSEKLKAHALAQGWPILNLFDAPSA